MQVETEADSIVASSLSPENFKGAGRGPAPVENQNSKGSPTDQWLELCLTLRSELRFEKRGLGNQAYIVVEDPLRSKFFQIGLVEFRLITELDGKRSLKQICDQLQQDSKDAIQANATDGSPTSCPSSRQVEQQYTSQLTTERVVGIAQFLTQNNLVFSPKLDSSKRLKQQADQQRFMKRVGSINPIATKIRLGNPNRLLRALQPYTSWIFSPWAVLIWLVTAGYAFSILFDRWQQVETAAFGIFSGYSWLWLLIAWVGLKLIHETAHGIACRKYGGEVPEAGVLLILLTPMAYVNVTSMWRFASRWERIVVCAAGMYVELFVSFLALFVWSQNEGVVAEVAFNIFLMASITTLLFNANPLMRFDGYFILADLLNITNLYTKGARWLGSRFKAMMFGLPATQTMADTKEKIAVPIYGLAAWCWKILIGISLIIGASVMFQGGGLILAAIAIVIWYLVPAWKQVAWFQQARSKNMINFRRLVISSVSLVGLMAITLFVLQAPPTKSAPAIVQMAGEQILRAGGDGFIRRIEIDNGQQVVAGQVLLELENVELRREIDSLKLEIEEARIWQRMKIKSGELAQSQATQEKIASLIKHLHEKELQQLALTLVAPADGLVFARRLSDRLNTFVKTGDELLSFAESSNREVIVSIDQRDWDSIQSSPDQPIRMIFPGRRVITTAATRIHPRASTKPIHPSLVATAGGPLPVRTAAAESIDNRQESQELLHPRFSIQVALPAPYHQELAAGQRGWAFFRASRQSMGSFLFVELSEWLREKIRQANEIAPI